jgi:hypothetical protein
MSRVASLRNTAHTHTHAHLQMHCMSVVCVSPQAFDELRVANRPQSAHHAAGEGSDHPTPAFAVSPRVPFQAVVVALRDAAAVLRMRQQRGVVVGGAGTSEDHAGMRVPTSVADVTAARARQGALDLAALFRVVDASERPTVQEIGELCDVVDDAPPQVQEAALRCLSRLCDGGGPAAHTRAGAREARGCRVASDLARCGMIDELAMVVCVNGGAGARAHVAAAAADALASIFSSFHAASRVRCLDADAAQSREIVTADMLSAGLGVLVDGLCGCIAGGRVGPLALATARACHAAAKSDGAWSDAPAVRRKLVALLAERRRVGALLSVTAGTSHGVEMVSACHGLLQRLVLTVPGAGRELLCDSAGLTRLADQLVTGMCVQRRRALETVAALCSVSASVDPIATRVGPSLIRVLEHPACAELRTTCSVLLLDLLSPTRRAWENKRGAVTERIVGFLRSVTLPRFAESAATALHLTARDARAAMLTGSGSKSTTAATATSAAAPLSASSSSSSCSPDSSRGSTASDSALVAAARLVRRLCELDLDGRLLYTDKYLKERRYLGGTSFEAVGFTVAK